MSYSKFSIINVSFSLRRGRVIAGIVAAIGFVFLVSAPRRVLAQDQPVDFVKITPQVRLAIDRGLEYLAQTQGSSGGYGMERAGEHVGITALAALAFMADGNLPGRGRYGPQVERALRYVLDNAQETGLIASDNMHGPMYGHGFATLFLGEIYGQAPDPRIRDALIRAVRLIVATQNPKGGWRYQPTPVDADISVTICQIMALRSARNAGIGVPKATIDRAIQYVHQCQNPSDGGFRYQIGAGESAFPRSAAGVASLYYAGVYQDEALVRGLDYLLRSKPRMIDGDSGHYFYGHYYAAQAMYLAGGQYWAQWYPTIRQELLSQQRPRGHWESGHGDAYGTAMALLVLEVPNRLLPIFQR